MAEEKLLTERELEKWRNRAKTLSDEELVTRADMLLDMTNSYRVFSTNYKLKWAVFVTEMRNRKRASK